MICVSLGRTRHKMVIAEHELLAKKNVPLVELRLDWIGRQPKLNQLIENRPTPVVVTCRRSSDKGKWRGTEEQRQALLRSAIAAGVEYVDLEHDIAESIPRYGNTRRIISHHDFIETPDDLEDIYREMCKQDADIIKIVTMANKPSDMVRMLRMVAGSTVPTVGFCMGEIGLPSRILCGKYGSPFTYASFSNERELAPGQVSYDVMREVYHYDDINADTKVFGVLGDPIGHSMSPLIHNAAFRHEKMNCVYLPFRVPEEMIDQTLHDFHSLDIKGYSVTIPLKELVIAHGQRKEASVEAIGAANTLYRDHNNDWRVANTDYDAALASIREGIKENEYDDDSLQGKKVLMMGAGGVARAIGLGVIRSGAILTIANRTSKRAKKLAAELSCQTIGWENRGTIFSDVIINCTPIGMHPDVDDTPFEEYWLRENTLVFDTIYNPENTLLLKLARERNCRTVSGLDMFVRQAAAQFERFTQQPAPLEVMREKLREGISPLNSMF
jgi:3-dehydroquinate dehydratase / shikimate dehydrogenase